MGLFGPSSFETAKALKDTQRSAAIEKATKVLADAPLNPDLEEEIVHTPAWQIADKIKAKEWSSFGVVTAFARRCLEAHKDTNCLTESPKRAFGNERSL
jgi:hypothetical protein